MNLVSMKPERLMICPFFSQNGGVDGRIHDGTTDPPWARHTRAPSVDSLNGNVASNNSFSAPVDREDSAFTEARGANGSAGVEALDSDTRQLLLRFFTDNTGLSTPSSNESTALSTMKRVVKDLLARHRYVYNGMITRIPLEKREDVAFIMAVATSIFVDGITNWGRIVSLVAFGAVLCRDLKERGRNNAVEQVADQISTILVSQQKDWLLENNSWAGFVDFFEVADPEANTRNTLMAFVGFAAMAALTLLMR